MAVALTIGIVMNLFQISLDFINEEKRAEKILDEIIQASLPTAVDIAYKLDKEGANELVEGLILYDFIEHVLIIDDSGDILAERTTSSDQKSKSLWFTKLIYSEFNEKISKLKRKGEPYSFGELIVKASNDKIYDDLYMRSLILFLSGLARNLFLSLVLLAVFYILLTRPLLQISSFFKLIHPEKSKGERLPMIVGHEKDEMGEIVQWANQYLDSADKHFLEITQAQQEVESKTAYLQNILTTTVEGFLRIDKENIIRDTNPSMARMLSLEESVIIGKNIYVFVDEKNREVLAQQLIERKRGEPSSYLISFLNNDGDKIPCSANATPLYDEDKNYAGSFAFISDMRTAIAAEEEKKRLEAELFQVRKIESIGTLAGGIAHDFNNILAAIMGYSELALDELPPDSNVRSELQEVLTAANRGKNLVQQILDFSRQTTSKSSLIGASQIVIETVNILRPSLPADIEINLNIDGFTDAILVDPVKIQQVIINLCTNAYHSMEADGGQLSIELKRTVHRYKGVSPDNHHIGDGHVELMVKDTGSGIPDEIMDRIFDPFFTTKEVGKGTGMGLSIVYGIIESYGGEIVVESELDEGTTFKIYLPIAKEAEEHRQYRVERIPTGQERILFVDDEIQIVEMTSRLLSQLGYSVTTRTSSVKALELFRLKPNDFDLVISDITMPKMTGDRLAKKLLQIRPDIPVILCTGYSERLSEEKALENGIKAFAYKPIVKNDLAQIIREVLDGAKSDIVA